MVKVTYCATVEGRSRSARSRTYRLSHCSKDDTIVLIYYGKMENRSLPSHHHHYHHHQQQQQCVA